MKKDEVVCTNPNTWIFNAFGEAELCFEEIFVAKVFVDYFI